MGLMDKLKSMFGGSKAKDLAAEHGDKVVQGVDKATDVVDDKTGGKHSEHLQKADDAAESAVDKLQGEQ